MSHKPRCRCPLCSSGLVSRWWRKLLCRLGSHKWTGWLQEPSYKSRICERCFLEQNVYTDGTQRFEDMAGNITWINFSGNEEEQCND